MIQQTWILIKPDGLVRSLTGNILTRLSETQLEIVAAKITRVSRELAEAHYQQLKDKPFFPELIRYLQGELHDRRKVMALVYWGEEAVAKARQMVGETNPEQASPVSIRGSYGRVHSTGLYENVIHASATLEEAEREIKLWFKPDDVIVDLYPTRLVKCDGVTLHQWA